MTDKELLTMAAKAAGIKVIRSRLDDPMHRDFLVKGGARNQGQDAGPWNPLTDDGDALRLAVKLGISTLPYPVYDEKERHSILVKQRRSTDLLREKNPTEVIELYGDDPLAAARRAITRAAAEIGRAMP